MGKMKRAEVPTSLLLRPNEAAALMACARSSIYGLMARGELGYVRVGADRRIPRSEIERYIQAALVRAKRS